MDEDDPLEACAKTLREWCVRHRVKERTIAKARSYLGASGEWNGIPVLDLRVRYATEGFSCNVDGYKGSIAQVEGLCYIELRKPPHCGVPHLASLRVTFLAGGRQISNSYTREDEVLRTLGRE